MTTESLQKWRENCGETEKAEPKNPYQKFRENNTRKTAIEAFCMRCMGTEDPDNPQPGYRTDIKGCTAPGCPLYNWRPYR
jgi:hypothetical protein